MHVFLVFDEFLFVGESYYSVIYKCCCAVPLLCMPDKVCELVSLTHQRADTLVSDNERVVVTGNARSVGPSASVAPLPAQRC